MELIATDAVSARGLRQVTGPATFGQRYTWDIVQSLEPHAEHLNITIVAEVTAHLDVGEGVHVLRELWSRHESFRTAYMLDGSGVLVQDVSARVEFPVTILRAPPDASAAEVDATLNDHLSGHFDVAEHEQARGAVVTDGARVRWLGVALCHMVADGWAITLLRREIENLAAGRACGVEDLVHPCDHTRFELSDAGRRANDASLEYWIRSLESFPTAYPGEGQRDAERPRYRDVSLISSTINDGSRATAAKLGVSPTTVVVGAFAELLADRTGLSKVPFVVRTANRRPAILRSVGQYAQASPLMVRTAPTTPRAVFQSLLVAECRGHYNPADLTSRINETWPDRRSRPTIIVTINPIPSPARVLGDASSPFPAGPVEPKVSTGFGCEEENVTVYCNAALDTGFLSLFVDTTFISTADTAKGLRTMYDKLLAGDIA
jgi:hypothetical protein